MEQRDILFNVVSLSENDCPIQMGKESDSLLCVGKCPDNIEEEKEIKFK